MWLHLLHYIGLTNLMDAQVEEYVNLQRATTGTDRSRPGLLLYTTVLLTTVQTASLVVVAVVSFQLSRQLSTLNKTDSQQIMPKEALVLTSQVSLATVPEKVLYIGNMKS